MSTQTLTPQASGWNVAGMSVGLKMRRRRYALRLRWNRLKGLLPLRGRRNRRLVGAASRRRGGPDGLGGSAGVREPRRPLPPYQPAAAARTPGDD